ncbi:cold shock domain-containing protein [Photobacterium damselae subsp. piscicida]|nr:cold shock domain-containing protein [Photobacterium damselae subsp. piscicida]MDP2556537.1 cold shock domain-containing protein [Photobacterium damselae subsp. piscicida]MDP2567574.1 cold shock domain-containing protein [Photobacterium damselae subsp. piscicida]
MTSQTGIIRSFNPAEKKGLITCDLGGDISFDASQISCTSYPTMGSMVEFTLDESNSKLKAVKSVIYNLFLFVIDINARLSPRVVTPIDLLMVKFTFYKRSNNLIVHLFAFRKTNGFSY